MFLIRTCRSPFQTYGEKKDTFRLIFTEYVLSNFPYVNAKNKKNRRGVQKITNPLIHSLFIGGIVIRMKGNKAQIIAVNGDYGPERTCDSYRIEGVAFPGLHVPDFL